MCLGRLGCSGFRGLGGIGLALVLGGLLAVGLGLGGLVLLFLLRLFLLFLLELFLALLLALGFLRLFLFGLVLLLLLQLFLALFLGLFLAFLLLALFLFLLFLQGLLGFLALFLFPERYRRRACPAPSASVRGRAAAVGAEGPSRARAAGRASAWVQAWGWRGRCCRARGRLLRQGRPEFSLDSGGVGTLLPVQSPEQRTDQSGVREYGERNRTPTSGWTGRGKLVAIVGCLHSALGGFRPS